MDQIALRRLFGAFLRLGATAYGGPAMMAYLRQQCVGRHRWLSEQEFKEGMAPCQIIPGATMMQMATYVGYRQRGMPGALTAAVAFVLPASLLMVGLSAAYFAFGELALVKAVFRGLAAVVIAIILNACVSLARTTLSGWQGPLLAAGAHRDHRHLRRLPAGGLPGRPARHDRGILPVLPHCYGARPTL